MMSPIFICLDETYGMSISMLSFKSKESCVNDGMFILDGGK